MIERVTEPSVLEGYLQDASHTRGHAEALLRPRNAEEAAEVVSHCQSEGIPLTISASRTSTTGAPVPRGGWILSTERLTGPAQIGGTLAEAPAGVLLGDLQREIESSDRLYPPDPTSRDECTLGGTLACNASGARSFKYGPTRRWVEGVEVVLPTGAIRSFTRGDPIPAEWPVVRWEEPRVKTAAGYAPPGDAVDVFVGQEGTLGIVTRATLRLAPLPRGLLALLAFFPDRGSAFAFARSAREAARRDPAGPFAPCSLEYLDRTCLDLARASGVGVPPMAGAAILCEQEASDGVEVEAHLDAWSRAFGEGGALRDETIASSSPSGRERLRRMRHAIPEAMGEWLERAGLQKIATDLAVPPDVLDEMADRYEASPVPHCAFGHVGDDHLHVNLLPNGPREVAIALRTRDELTGFAIAHGGTVSGEHGIGKLKVRALARMVSPSVLDGFRRLKSTLDPAWILGRGTMLDPPADT